MSFEELINQIGLIDLDEAIGWIDDVKYKGLDLSAITAELMAKTKGNKDMVVGLKYLVMAGMYRGNRIDKILKSMETDKAKVFRSYVDHFNVKSSINDGAQRGTTITLSRLRLAIPIYSAILLQSPAFVRPVPVTKLKEFYEISTFPLVFRDISIASLIPNEVTKEFNEEQIKNCLMCILGYIVLENTVIGKDKTLSKENVDMLNGFMSNNHDSSHIPLKSRLAFMTKYVDAGVLTYASVAANKIRAKLATLK